MLGFALANRHLPIAICPVSHPISSAVYRVVTKADSFVSATFLPVITLTQTMQDSIMIMLTRMISPPQTAASRRSLKMRRAMSAVVGCAASKRACASSPISGLGLNILAQEAVNVTAMSQANGARVIHMYRARPLFTRIVVATQSATVASNWLQITNSG